MKKLLFVFSPFYVAAFCRFSQSVFSKFTLTASIVPIDARDFDRLAELRPLRGVRALAAIVFMWLRPPFDAPFA